MTLDASHRRALHELRADALDAAARLAPDFVRALVAHRAQAVLAAHPAR